MEPKEHLSQFDFSQPVNLSNSVENFDSVEKVIKQKLFSEQKKTKSERGNYKLLLLVFVLFLGLIATGSFSLLQTLRIQELEQKVNLTEQVAGVKDESMNSENYIVGSGWTLILPEQPPQGFVLETELKQADYLNRQVAVSRFLAKVNKGGLQLLSGIEIEVAEFDNRMNYQEFVNLIKDYLGAKYIQAGQPIVVSEQFSLTKFTPKSKDDPVYYVTLTLENYYLIKVFNQTEKFPDLINYTRFTDGLIERLWLN